jgi:predicted RNase H-like HicB family nuclease
MDYIAILEKEPESLWGVYFPDLPGCVTAGQTADQATRRAVEALRLYVETAGPDQAMPQPRSLDDLLGDPEISAALAAGAVAFRVPVVAASGKPERVNISVDSGVLRAVDQAARAAGLTRSAFLSAAAEAKIADMA